MSSRYLKPESSQASDLESSKEKNPPVSGNPRPESGIGEDEHYDAIAGVPAASSADSATIVPGSTSEDSEQHNLDEAIRILRAAESPADRAAAARTLGALGSQSDTAPLVAALFDDAPEVRHAAGEALAQLSDTTVSYRPVNPLTIGEIDWSAPEVVQPTTRAEAADADRTFPVVTAGDSAGVGGGLPTLLDEEETANTVRDLEQRIAETAAARQEAENRARLCAESEARVRSQVAVRRRGEEEVRKQAEEEATRRRAEEEERLAAEHATRVRLEEEATSFAEEETRLTLEALKLGQAADELAKRRSAIEDAARMAQIAAAERRRREAEEQHTAELDRLRSEEDALRHATEEVSQRRSEVDSAHQEVAALLQRQEEEKSLLAAAAIARDIEAERLQEVQDNCRAEQEQLLLRITELRGVAEEVAARRATIEAAKQNAEDEARRLAESQTRIEEAEENRRQAEAQRLQLEAEIHKRAEAERQLLVEARLRVEAEHEDLEEAARLRAAEELELVALRNRMEVEAREQLEKEQKIRGEVENLLIAEAEARNRIEEAEGNRRRAEKSLSLTVEILQRVEAEAHARTAEEERILARLEDVSRNVALEAQAREEQEKRIREEIEHLRGLEEGQRQRLEQETHRRREAESLLQYEKDRYRAEEDARIKAEVALQLLRGPEQETGDKEGQEWHDDPAENLRPVTAKESTERGEEAPQPVRHGFDELAGSGLSATIAEQLNSADPFQRAAALSELAQSGDPDGFALIVKFFDDQSVQVRNAAAWALRELEPHRPVESFTRALEGAAPERRQNIGSAIATSGLAAEAIEALRGDNQEDTYNALCLLLAMAKTGELQPLVQAVEEHSDVEVRRAAVKLLTLAGKEEIAGAAAKRRLDVEG